jgi:methyl-accepting chemotaxis protein
LVQAVAVFKLAGGDKPSAASDSIRAAAPVSAPAPAPARSVAAKPAAAKAAAAVERRGPNRAKNVVRPDFKTPVAAPASQTGTDDWESF